MLIDIILQDSSEPTIILEHHLEGLAYRRFKGFEHLKKSWMNIYAHGDCLYTIGRELSLKFSDLVVLKGVGLLNNVYDDFGVRFMSDIDVLVSTIQYEELSQYLLDNGYKVIRQRKWYGDNFKTEFNKVENGRELNIEVHTKLFYHVENINYETQYDGIIRRLSLEMMLVHLIGHCAHGHNFQKLYWLYDIYFYVDKFNEKINVDKFILLIKKHMLVNSTQATFYLLEKYFQLPSNFKNFYRKEYYYFLLDEEFILNPNQGGAKNYFIKHLLKDQFLLSFKYDLFWMINKCAKIFIRK